MIDGPLMDLKHEPEPVLLEDGLDWYEWDVDDDDDIHSLYELLRDNYVEDNDQLFRFDYQPSFLRWALKSPNWTPTLHVAVKQKHGHGGIIVGFISATVVNLLIRNKYLDLSIILS